MSEKKTTLKIIIFLILVILVAFFVWFLIRESDPDCCSDPDAPQQSENNLPLKGTDGPLDFTITEIDCGIGL